VAQNGKPTCIGVFGRSPSFIPRRVPPTVAELTVFEALFETLPDGRVTPRVWVQIGGTRYGPGASFGPNFRPSGLAPDEWRGCKIGAIQKGMCL
jgi:hypothetical protein